MSRTVTSRQHELSSELIGKLLAAFVLDLRLATRTATLRFYARFPGLLGSLVGDEPGADHAHTGAWLSGEPLRKVAMADVEAAAVRALVRHDQLAGLTARLFCPNLGGFDVRVPLLAAATTLGERVGPSSHAIPTFPDIRLPVPVWRAVGQGREAPRQRAAGALMHGSAGTTLSLPGNVARLEMAYSSASRREARSDLCRRWRFGVKAGP